MYDIEPTSDQERSAHETIQVASLFERQRLDLMPWEDADIDLGRQIATAEEKAAGGIMSLNRNRPNIVRFAGWNRPISLWLLKTGQDY